jgi:hypothetical protein
MNRPDFIHLLQHPKSDIAEIGPLEELVQRFPYCQASQVLLAYQLFRKNDLGFNAQLRKAAAYTSSRTKLKGMFKEEPVKTEAVVAEVEIVPTEDPLLIEEFVEIEKPFEEQEPRESVPVDSPVVPADLDVPSSEKQRKLTLLDIVNKRLAEIEAEKRAVAPEPEVITEKPVVMSKEALIDKFIIEEPRISRPKAEFYSPSELAAKSSLDEEEIVSETLARLYGEQGNNEKAKHIYKKLSLLFPEKSSYFAAQIEKLG